MMAWPVNRDIQIWLIALVAPQRMPQQTSRQGMPGLRHQQLVGDVAGGKPLE